MTQEEVWIFANTVSMAQLGKLNPDQITLEALASILEFLKLATSTRKLVCLVQSTRDIFTMSMSYVDNCTDKVFYFIVHIPLVQPEQVMDTFEYVSFPMTLLTSETLVALPRPGAHNILAINQNQEYQLLSSGELQHCFKLAKVHYCKGRQILKTNVCKSCLGALYVKDSEAASWYCDFQIQPANDRVFKLSWDEYLVYTRKDLLATRTFGATQTQLEITEGTPDQSLGRLQRPIGRSSDLRRRISGPSRFRTQDVLLEMGRKEDPEEHLRVPVQGCHPRAQAQDRGHSPASGPQLREDRV